jgi:hypothetical protein
LSTVLERNRPSKPTNSRRIARRATAIKLTNQSTSHEVGEQ